MTEKPNTRPLRAIKGLETNTTPAFRRKLILMADRAKLNADYLASVIAYETARTFRADIKNPGSSATGLIQFLESTAKKLGTTTARLAGMTATEQLDYVEKYYRFFGALETLEDHYLVVFAGRRASPDAILFKAPSASYTANKHMDRDGDGIITGADATRGVRSIYDEAAARPPLDVDMAVPVWPACLALFALGGAAAAAYWVR